MRLRHVRPEGGRAAFTLIELLVVISIIAVLVGLLSSGVMATLQARDRSGNSYDIGKMDTSMGAALAKYGGSRKTLPGQLVLYNNIDKYRNPTTHGITNAYELVVLNRSKDVLRSMFGSRFITNANLVSWDGSAGASLNQNPMILEGQQVLVFYLGGMPQAGTGGAFRMVGFSTDPLNPTLLPSRPGEDRIGPFYEFESNRLMPMASRTFAPAGGNPFGTTANGAAFMSYKDRYGTPYAYFGGTGGANTYVSFCPSLAAVCPNNPEPAAPTSADNLGGPLAYQEVARTATTPARWTKPEGWQIVSAGRLRQFGAGGLWTPTQGTLDAFGRDDQSNFAGALLGSP